MRIRECYVSPHATQKWIGKSHATYDLENCGHHWTCRNPST